MNWKEHLICKRALPTIAWLDMLNSAAQCEVGEYTPLDCHCDIQQDVAWLLGYYQAQEERGGHGDASGMSVLDMILHDTALLLKEMQAREIEERRTKTAYVPLTEAQ